MSRKLTLKAKKLGFFLLMKNCYSMRRVWEIVRFSSKSRVPRGLGILFLFFLMAACQPTPVFLPGDVMFEDDFSTRAYPWTTLHNEKGIMGYDAGGFRFHIDGDGVNYWATPGLNFDDVRVEVDLAPYGGPVQNRMGVLCRYQNDENFYFFVISADGYYAIGKVLEGEQSLINQQAMRYSSAIQQGVALNHLRAECDGSTLRFYINDAPVALVEDASLAEGDVGLLVGTFEEGGLDVLFDNFAVLQP